MGGRYFQRRHRYTMNKCNEIGQLFEEVMRIMVCWSQVLKKTIPCESGYLDGIDLVARFTVEHVYYENI